MWLKRLLLSPECDGDQFHAPVCWGGLEATSVAPFQPWMWRVCRDIASSSSLPSYVWPEYIGLLWFMYLGLLSSKYEYQTHFFFHRKNNILMVQENTGSISGILPWYLDSSRTWASPFVRLIHFLQTLLAKTIENWGGKKKKPTAIKAKARVLPDKQEGKNMSISQLQTQLENWNGHNINVAHFAFICSKSLPLNI